MPKQVKNKIMPYFVHKLLSKGFVTLIFSLSHFRTVKSKSLVTILAICVILQTIPVNYLKLCLLVYNCLKLKFIGQNTVIVLIFCLSYILLISLCSLFHCYDCYGIVLKNHLIIRLVL